MNALPSPLPSLAPSLQMNSVVLKQESPWIEYYYRSLQPGTHVLTYNTSNLLSLLQAYNVSLLRA